MTRKAIECDFRSSNMAPAILWTKLKEIKSFAYWRCTQGNIVRRKHHVPVHGVPSTAIIVPNYVRYDAKTSLDY